MPIRSSNAYLKKKEAINVILPDDFILKFETVLELLSNLELTKRANQNQISKIENSILSLLAFNYTKSYTLANEVLNQNSNIPAALFLKIFLEALDAPKSDDSDNFNVLIKKFKSSFDNNEIEKTLVYALDLMITNNYVSRLCYFLNKTAKSEDKVADEKGSRNAAYVASIFTSVNALDEKRTSADRKANTLVAAASFGSVVQSDNQINSMLAIRDSTYKLAIIYSKMSAYRIQLLSIRKNQNENLQSIFEFVFSNWKNANLKLLDKNKSNLVSKLTKLKSNFYNPSTISEQENYNYSDFYSFEITLDLLGLDNHPILTENLIKKFVEKSEYAFKEEVNLIEMQKVKSKNSFLNISYLVLLIAGFIALTNDVFSWWAVIGLIIYIPVSKILNHGKVHKELSNNCKELLFYLKQIEFTESDIELSKIGLD